MYSTTPYGICDSDDYRILTFISFAIVQMTLKVVKVIANAIDRLHIIAYICWSALNQGHCHVFSVCGCLLRPLGSP